LPTHHLKRINRGTQFPELVVEARLACEVWMTKVIGKDRDVCEPVADVAIGLDVPFQLAFALHAASSSFSRRECVGLRAKSVASHYAACNVERPAVTKSSPRFTAKCEARI
jgi:hypothetical protein